MDPGYGFWTNMAASGVLDLRGGALAKPVAARPRKATFEGAVLWGESLDRRQVIHLGAEPAGRAGPASFAALGPV